MGTEGEIKIVWQFCGQERKKEEQGRGCEGCQGKERETSVEGDEMAATNPCGTPTCHFIIFN